MTFLGIAVRVSREVPYLRGVLIDENTPGDLSQFEFTPPAAGTNADHILTIANGLEGRLSVLASPLTRVVLRLGDERQGHGTNTRVARTRTEGAVMFVARRGCADVRALHGKEIGIACGTDKAGADAQAQVLISEERWMAAASAAIAARSL